MKLPTILIVSFLVLSAYASAAQTTRLTPNKAITSDVSTDGNATFNTTQNGVFQVNNSPISFGHWGDFKLGNLTNATLSAYRTWTLPDLTGTLVTLEGTNTWTAGQTFNVGPTFTDYSNANHDHLDTDDGGTLSAGAIATGTMSRSRLPAELAYEDEANTFAVRVTLSDGSTVNGYLYISAPNLLQANGTFVAKTNSYHEGIATFNSTIMRLTGAGSGQTASVSADDLVIDSTTTAGISILTPNTANGVIFFGDPQDSGVGFLQYIHSTNTFEFGSAGTQRVTFNSNGLRVIDDIEIEQALNHDGTTVGFYATTPITQRAGPTSTTDNTGGTPSTCENIAAGALYTQQDMQRVRDCLSTLILKLNDLTADIDALGLTS